MCKLKIDLHAGIIEVEGEEAFVQSVYNDYKAILKDFKTPQQAPAAAPQAKAPSKKTSSKAPAAPKRKRSSSREEYDEGVLNFSVADVKELREFYQEKNPASGFERNVVFVYFMQKKKGVTEITPSHVYACYNAVNVKFPSALKQSLIDTNNKKGWLNTSDTSDIKLTLSGESLVVHDLPRNKD